MNCKKKIDDAVARIIQCLKDECTIVPSPGWLMDGTIRTELALIEQESTHLMEVITSTMDELTTRERELLNERRMSLSMNLPARAKC